MIVFNLGFNFFRESKFFWANIKFILKKLGTEQPQQHETVPKNVGYEERVERDHLVGEISRILEGQLLTDRQLQYAFFFDFF